jgi:hypothetical protein
MEKYGGATIAIRKLFWLSRFRLFVADANALTDFLLQLLQQQTLKGICRLTRPIESALGEILSGLCLEKGAVGLLLG